MDSTKEFDSFLRNKSKRIWGDIETRVTRIGKLPKAQTRSKDGRSPVVKVQVCVLYHYSIYTFIEHMS
jgi:hypothetical protein